MWARGKGWWWGCSLPIASAQAPLLPFPWLASLLPPSLGSVTSSCISLSCSCQDYMSVSFLTVNPPLSGNQTIRRGLSFPANYWVCLALLLRGISPVVMWCRGTVLSQPRRSFRLLWPSRVETSKVWVTLSRLTDGHLEANFRRLHEVRYVSRVSRIKRG